MQQTLSRASASTVRRSLFLTTVLTTAFAGINAWAQTQPPANTVIGNQATATYTDSGNIQRTASSNTVQTTVLQVAALDLTANNTKQAPPGSPVYFPHTVVNNGNGTDTINLSASDNSGDDFNIGPLTIYADADGNGLPDNTTPITNTGPLAPGQSFRFVVGGTVPNNETNGEQAQITVTATSQLNNAISDTNIDTVEYSTNAVINVQKSININRGPSPSNPPYVYTLTYSNIGNSAATNLTITDVIPTGMLYNGSSGRWSVAPVTPLDDASGANDPDGINYVVSGNTVTATIANVPVGATGSVSFAVRVNSGVPPQTLNNTASLEYDDDPGAGVNLRTGTSNTVVFTVTATAAVNLEGDTVTDAPEGGVVRFNNVLTNNGTAPDIFDITINTAGSTFPAGSSYQLYQQDGFSPMLDSNGNGIPDTGLVAVGANYTVVLKVTLPGNVPTSPAGPFSVIKTATSTNNPNVSDPGTDTLNSITQATVDVTNNSANGPGAGAGPEGAPVTTNTATPGTTSRFTLVIENTSSVPDNYNLSVDTGLGALPAGFTVTFRNTAGGIITNTGILAGDNPNVAGIDGGTITVYADVFVPANAGPQNVELYFRATSPTSGATDVKRDRLTVAETPALSIEPNNTGQTYQGGAITYSHILANNGNTTLSNIALSLINTQPGFTAVIYQDLNNNGVLDPAEAATPLSSVTSLAPTETVPVLVRVFAPSGANPGQVNVTTITATDGSLTDTATDTTTIVVGDVRVEKLQSVNGGGFTADSRTALPGQPIRYRLIVTNTGAAPVTQVVVNDTTPAYTTFLNSPPPTIARNGGAAGALPGGSSVPSNGSSGSISVNVGTLNPNDTAVIEFSVRINPLQNP